MPQMEADVMETLDGTSLCLSRSIQSKDQWKHLHVASAHSLNIFQHSTQSPVHTRKATCSYPASPAPYPGVKEKIYIVDLNSARPLKTRNK